MAIFSLSDLNKAVKLQNNATVTIWTLLKSIPPLPGMSRNRLFQVVDPNAG